MQLPSSLLREFARATLDSTTPEAEYARGTVVQQTDEGIFVQLDGATVLTPANTTADVSEGDRVTVMIKNHSATITGNYTSPAATSRTVTEVSENAARAMEDAATAVDVGETVLKNIEEGIYDGEDATVLRIDSSHGVLFKNSIFSTVLTVTIQRGSKTVTDADTLRAEYGAGAYLQWKWRKFDDEAFRTISSADSRLRRDGFELVVTPEDVDEKIVFQCDLEV